MDATPELLGIAQVAVGIAGFAGVAAAIMLSRSFERDDQLRFLALMFGTISVVLLAFVPMLLARAGLGDRSVWFWSSLVMIGVSLVGLPIGLTIRREAHGFRKVPPRWAFLLSWCCFASGTAAPALNLFGVLRGPGPVLYMAGLLGWLAAGAVMFGIVVLVRPPAAP